MKISEMDETDFIKTRNIEDIISAYEEQSRENDIIELMITKFHISTAKEYSDDRILRNVFLRWKVYSQLVRAKTKSHGGAEITQNIERTSLFRSSDSRKVKSPVIYKNRYKVQQDIIEQQKQRLYEQDRLIEELKLNIICEDLRKSTVQCQYNIQEIFKNCTNKTKCRIGKVLTDDNSQTEESAVAKQIQLQSLKIPKAIRKMEQRSLERELKRQVIRDRRHIIEEKRKQVALTAAEHRRVQDEEEIRLNLEAMREKRRQEVERDRVRQRNKQRHLNACVRADKVNRAQLQRNMFRQWRYALAIARYHDIRAEKHCDEKLKMGCWKTWVMYRTLRLGEKNAKADGLLRKKTLAIYWLQWKSLLRERKRNMYVAFDWYDMKLANNYFIHWHRHVCLAQIREAKLTNEAHYHYIKKIKFHFFFLWRQLPTVLALERAKEEKKRKWREKVRAVLPDYRPPNDD